MDNLPMIRKETFFSKIKNFFRRLFGRKEDISNDILVEAQNEISCEMKEEILPNEINKKDDFLEDFKKANKNNSLKEEIFQKVRQNPELKNTLSDKRLGQLLEIYYEKIDKVREENRQLQIKIENLQEIIKKES